MPTVSDYVVVADGTTTLQTGGDIDQTFRFSVPANVNLGQNAVATWQFEADGSPRNLAWNLSVNGTKLASFTHGIDRFSALQEVFPGSVLRTGNNNNEAIVKITGGTGRIKFSAFVIHMQVNV